MSRKSGRDSNRNVRNTPAGTPADKAGLSGRQILYVGGRDCQVAHLREIAQNFGAELIHHDGGLREAHRHSSALGGMRVLPDRLYQP